MTWPRNKSRKRIEQVKVKVEVETKPRIAPNDHWLRPLRSF